MKRLSILGSTGSIGVNTLHIVSQFPERFEVVSLSAGLNTQLLKRQILQFRPKIVSVLNKELSEALQKELPNVPVEIVHGVEGLIQVATHPLPSSSKGCWRPALSRPNVIATIMRAPGRAAWCTCRPLHTSR